MTVDQLRPTRLRTNYDCDTTQRIKPITDDMHANFLI